MLELLLKKTSDKWLAGVFLFAILVAADQFAKTRAHRVFQNHGFAFSLPLPNYFSFVIYAIVLAGMVYYCARNYHEFTTLQAGAWLLVFAGAAANVGERIALGYVRDFIYITAYRWTGIYNLADFYIITGIIIILFLGKDVQRKF